VLGVTLALALAALVPASVASASSPNDPNIGHQVTLCHNDNNLHAITVDVSAAGLQGGHEGHSGDIIPSFQYFEKVGNDYNDTPTVFPGLNLGTIYSGATGAEVLANGCQIPPPPPPPPPVDVCTNIDGNQSTIPAGLEDPDNDKVCTPVPPPDVCTNIDGNQTTIPAGLEDPDNDKVCTAVPLAAIDLCTNIDGTQSVLPADVQDPDGDRICTAVAGSAGTPSGSGGTPAVTPSEGTPTATETTTPTAAAVETPETALPFTGFSVLDLVWAGGGLLTAGLALWAFGPWLERKLRRA